MSTAVAEAKPASFSLVPSSFDDAMRIAEYLAKSDLVPKDYQQKPSNIVVAMAWGAEVGLQPLQALQNIAVINGRGSIWGDAALALCMSRNEFEDIEERIEGEGDNRVAICTVRRKGRTPAIRKFSVDDAKKARLWDTREKVTRWKDGQQKELPNDSPWFKYPERMLQMRARGFALRDSFPDAMRGLYLAEELQGGNEIDITDRSTVVGRESVVMPQASAPAAPASEPKPDPVAAGPVVIDQSTGEISPAATTAGDAKASANQVKVLRARLATCNIPETQLNAHFKLWTLEDIPAAMVSEASKWIKANARPAQ